MNLVGNQLKVALILKENLNKTIKIAEVALLAKVKYVNANHSVKCLVYKLNDDGWCIRVNNGEGTVTILKTGEIANSLRQRVIEYVNECTVDDAPSVPSIVSHLDSTYKQVMVVINYVNNSSDWDVDCITRLGKIHYKSIEPAVIKWHDEAEANAQNKTRRTNKLMKLMVPQTNINPNGY